jgi:hypothetical protein
MSSAAVPDHKSAAGAHLPQIHYPAKELSGLAVITSDDHKFK